MQTANIATAKYQFSRLIELVKQGETILITDRNKPVATLRPIGAGCEAGLEALHSSGLLSPPSEVLDMPTFLAAERPALSPASSLSKAVLEEREDGR